MLWQKHVHSLITIPDLCTPLMPMCRHYKLPIGVYDGLRNHCCCHDSLPLKLAES